MYAKSAIYYDSIYMRAKDYAQEAAKLHDFIQAHKRSAGTDLLDVACGTGLHLEHLQQHYTARGLDLSTGLLKIARERCPNVPFTQGDMTDFALGTQFDVVTCLFSAIGYVVERDRLQQAVRTMHRHLKPGGVLLIEPWFTPDQWKPGTPHANFVDEPDLKIARMTISEQHGHISRNDMHFLVATPAGVEHFVERHDLGLFTHEEYLAAFQASGLTVSHDEEGLTGRGLYIGVNV